MSQLPVNFFENNVFIFKSYACDCVEDIKHIQPGMPPQSTYKFQANHEKPLLFGYKAKTGLSRIATNGTSEEDNILGALIALPTKTQKDFYDFFRRNGFLFPISQSEYESIDASLLYEFILRIRATVELMTAVNEIHKDYEKIIKLTLYLMLADPLQIKTESLNEPYTTCSHSFMDVISKASGMSLSKERKQEAFNSGIYSVTDTITSPAYSFSASEYEDIISGQSINGTIPVTDLYRDITLLYCNYNGSDMERKTIDFLFHLQHDYSQIQSIDPLNHVCFINDADFSTLSDKMRSAITDIARFVLGEEINANLNGIYPQYDIKNMSPSWKVDSLLSAIYFSIFYIRPDFELYRQCANPRCRTYFLVSTTTTRKKFCSNDCCNRMTQDKYRKKKRENAE